jgi:hypothetical protein
MISEASVNYPRERFGCVEHTYDWKIHPNPSFVIIVFKSDFGFNSEIDLTDCF